MGLSILCLWFKITRQYIWTNQVGTPLTRRDIYWSLAISWRIGSSGSKPRNLSCINSISCDVWWWIFRSSIHEGRHNTPNIWQILCNAAHKVVHQRILNSGILGSLQILREIPDKLQLMCQGLHQKLIDISSHRCIPYNKCKRFWSVRYHHTLKLFNAQFPRNFKTHKIY